MEACSTPASLPVLSLGFCGGVPPQNPKPKALFHRHPWRQGRVAALPSFCRRHKRQAQNPQDADFEPKTGLSAPTPRRRVRRLWGFRFYPLRGLQTRHPCRIWSLTHCGGVPPQCVIKPLRAVHTPSGIHAASLPPARKMLDLSIFVRCAHCSGYTAGNIDTLAFRADTGFESNRLADNFSPFFFRLQLFI